MSKRAYQVKQWHGDSEFQSSQDWQNMNIYVLKNWAEGLSDEAYYPWSYQKNQLKSLNPTCVTEQKKVLIYR